jgi:hypothetical protein
MLAGSEIYLHRSSKYITKEYYTIWYNNKHGAAMSNPFKYGTVVFGEDFANRERELRELASRLKETVLIFLVAPRRYGKTSLIKNVLDEFQEIVKFDGENLERQLRAAIQHHTNTS